MSLSSSTELDRLRTKHPEIEYLDAIFPDMNNYIRGKRIPVDEANKLYRDGMQIPESSYLLDYEGASNDPCGRGFSDGDPDGTMFPIPGTTVYVPWGKANRAQALMQLFTDEGAPCLTEPRNIAQRVLDQFNELEHEVNLAFELEFYLIDRQTDATGRPQFLSRGAGVNEVDAMQVYSLSDLDFHDDFLHRIHRCCAVQNIPSSVVISEYAPSQFEINLRHVADPLKAADQCVLLKRVVQEVAKTMGMRATFMAKPFMQFNGNGMHIHLSLMNQQGENLFQGQSNLGSEQLHYAIGGIFELMPDMFGIFAPGRNSYRRFEPDMFVPVNRTWGFNNRSVTIRIPSGPDEARRLEFRVAGADANPYLVLACLLAGIYHGLTEKINPGQPMPLVNASCNIDPQLPLEWRAAIQRLHESELARKYLTPEYVDLYCAIKQDEIAQYSRCITDREYQLYL